MITETNCTCMCAHSCPTLCNPMDCSLPGSSVHEIFQERVLEWVAISFSNSILKSRDITLPTKVCIVSYGFSSSHVWMWELDYKESWVPKNGCFWTVVLKTLESPLDCKNIKAVNPIGNQSWIFTERTDAEAEALGSLATWCKNSTHWKRPWLWEKLRVGGEGGNRGWDGWMASLPQWTWVWANLGRWWRTGKPGVLQSMGSQRVRHDSVTKQQQKQLYSNKA